MGKSINAEAKLLDAALGVIRARGYAGTTVDDLCAAAGVTKGAFFHHFDSKEALAIAAAQHWATVTTALFNAAPYRKVKDPRDRVLAYIDYRAELVRGALPEFTCLVGTMVQEVYDSNPAIREACHGSIFGHAEDVAKDIEAAKKLYAPRARWSARGLALHFQAVIQGAFILAKADNSPAVALESLAHLRRYTELLLGNTQPKEKPRESR